MNKNKDHPILTMFLASLEKWKSDNKNKKKLEPPKTVQSLMCNDRSINNFLEQHTDVIEVEYQKVLIKYQVMTKYEGRRTYKVWLELIN
jgi:hypothetical protein